VKETLEPEEVASLLGADEAPADESPRVVERDFRSPRRVSTAQRDELTRTISAGLKRCGSALAGSFAGTGIVLGGIGEIDAERWIKELAEPLVVVRFRVGGQPAWIRWQPQGALALVELALGSRSSDDAQDRALFPVEAKLLRNLTATLLAPLFEGLEIAPSDWSYASSKEALGTWREGGAGSDPHRLVVDLSVERGADDAGSLQLLLPGFPRAPGASTGAPRSLGGALPGHLARIEVEMHAELPGAEIPLSQLLALEEGDVIPIEARVGDPLVACVEGRRFAHAELGQYRGQLAMRIEGFDPNPDENR